MDSGRLRRVGMTAGVAFACAMSDFATLYPTYNVKLAGQLERSES